MSDQLLRLPSVRKLVGIALVRIADGTVSLGCQLVLVDDFGGIHPWKEVRYGKDLVDLVKGTSFKTELETPYS